MVHPTFLLAVPLIYEKFYNTIQKTLKKQGQDKLVNTLFAANNITSKFGLNIAKPIANKIMAQFGGNIDMFIAGGARVDPKVLAFFRSMGIPCLQGYGLTETSPMVALNPDQWKYMRNDSAGKLFQFTECKIIDKDEDGIGEIIAKSDSVMLGYYENPEETAKVLRDGWLYTGDYGYIDEQGFLYITGRKKNVIVTKNGKNIFPEEVEYYLMKNSCVKEVIVGSTEGKDGDLVVTAHIVPDMDEVKAQAGDLDEEELRKFFKKIVDEVNDGMSSYKRIKKFKIRHEEFEKTSTRKIKRFGANIEDN